MTLDHDDFDQRIADADDLDALDADTISHAEECARCQARLELSRRIRTAAPTLIEDNGNDNITDAVLARTHREPSRLPKYVAVAAAAIVVAGTAGVVLRSPSSEPDVLADIADDYRSSEAIRFAYATEASIDISEQFDLDRSDPTSITALSAQIPICTDAEDGEDEAQAGIDLSPIADAIASNDPCLALKLIDESAQPAQDAYEALARSVNSTQTAIDSVASDQANRDLVAASVDAFVEDQQAQLEVARNVLIDLDRSYTALVDTVEPLSSGGANEFAVGSVETGLIALNAQAAAAKQIATNVDPVVEWTQITTGTWTPTAIEVEGVTEREASSASYGSVADDPLGLAQVMLGRPNILTDLLDSAPPSTDDVIEWTVPAGVLDGDTDWTATAQLSGERLRELRLQSSVAVVTLSPER